ncbi:MAG: protein phosphatase 2C domain-containing protein, partial [Glaciecola sp.]
MNISFVSTSIAGIKSTNQDACAAYIDTEAHTKTKGFAFAIADGISSSSVSGAASHYATQQFIKEYYLTPDIWSTEKSCRQLLSLINNNLYTNSKSRDLHLNLDKGYVCTFTGAVIKDNICHLFDIGDSQAYLLRNKQLTLLTEDDEVATEAGQYYLSAGLGMPDIKPLRYSTHQLESDDVLLLLTDGLSDIIETLIINDYDNAVFFNDDHTLSQWMDKALQFGATDNLTLQVIRIDGLSERTQHEPEKLLTPAPLNEGEKVDGLQVIRSLYQSPRSHVYLVKDKAESLFALKCLSLECADDPVAFEQLGMEQWALRRITSRHVVRAHLPTTPSKA